MIYYKINLKLQGGITQLPDSQRIFGFLISKYAEKTSALSATELVRKVREKQIQFQLSNMMPSGYLPTPIEEILALDSEEKIYKVIKERTFLKEEMIGNILKNISVVKRAFPFVKIKELYQPHTAISSSSHQLVGMQNVVYAVPEIDVIEVSGEDESEKIVRDFQIYLSVEEDDILKLVKEMQMRKSVLYLGKRASLGYNNFVIESIEKCETQRKSDNYLNLGMLLPDKINYEESALKLFTSERRPYESKFGQGKIKGQVISFIDAGSYIFTTANSNQAGKSIESPFDKERAIIFGNSFLYPMRKGGK
ncbi:hypothetical protein [Listeria sp. ILCC792]|uniref:hypothetical protein n=1 Tax=Listeria sp. ILCC792 TaxID=1918331 RepID=UPI000B591342|nr:hypothetical protein [Listeria sp. ILCC792]